MSVAPLCGPLVLGGFSGPSLTPAYARALRDGRRSGAVLFRSNVEGGLAQISALAREIHALAPRPLLAIDQEGGRVARLRSPALEVPPMRTIASSGDPAWAETVAHAVGRELAALGFTVNFAPVVDVDTRGDNPIIGDRAFSNDPAVCGRFGAAWIRGLQSAGLLATAKHFPGHGDTSEDSHVDLPIVDQPRSRLEAVELAPFRAAVSAGVALMMTAHVVYPAIDGERPATLSAAIATELRAAIAFDGVLVSDDLEMKAIADRGSIGEAAVQSVAAGCDLVLVCHSFDEQEKAVDALIRETERSPAFRARCEEARRRVSAARARATATPLDDAAVAQIVGGEGSRAVQAEIRRRGGA